MNNIDTRYSAKTDPNSRLRYGIIEVTTKCQLRCPGCYMVRREALNLGTMPLNQAVKILDMCKNYCGQELETMDILGGEPLLWPHLKEYIEILLHRDIKPWIFTNMLAVTPKLAEWLRQREIHITGKLNIGDPNDTGQIHLQAEMIGSTEKTAKKMFEAIKIFQNAGYDDPLMFRLQNLLRKKNLPFVPGYVRFCWMNNIGVDLELMGSGEAIEENYFTIAPTPKELAELVHTLSQQNFDLFPNQKNDRKTVEKSIYTPESVLMPHLFGSCPFYDKGLYFAVDGHIRSCSNSTKILAHVTDPDPIRKAYESPLICQRKQLCQQNVGEPCHSCDRWEKCRGGCRATVEGMGDPFGGYTLCPVPHLK